MGFSNRIAKYQIKTLSNDDFDKLPYKRAIESAGITDRILGICFIRDTGDFKYDEDTLQHEIMEMESVDSPWGHEDENGVRYKKWYQYITDALPREIPRQVYQAIAGAIPGVGPVLSTALGTAYGRDAANESGGNKTLGSIFGAAEGYSMGNVGAGVKGGIQSWAKPGGTSFMKDFGAGASEAIKSYGINPTISKAASGLLNFGGTSTTGVGSTSGINSFSPIADSVSKAGTANIGSGIGSSSSISAITKNALSSGVGSGIGSSGGIGGFLNNPLAKIGVGVGSSLLGQFGKKYPEVPQSGYMNQIGAGGLEPKTAVGKQAMETIQQQLNQGWTGLPEDYKNAVLSDFDKQFQQEEDALRNEYKSLRPNADIESDSAFKKDWMDLKARQTQDKNNTLAKLEQQEQQDFNNRKLQYVQQATGLDQQTLQQYTQLAELDLQQIMFQTGLDYAQAQSFKDMFADIGSLFIQSGLGMDKFNIGNILGGN